MLLNRRTHRQIVTVRAPSSGPRVLLGVSGSIAAYKAMEVARLLLKAGVEVQAALTKGAQRFITPLSFQAITGRRTLTSVFEIGDEIEHVERAHDVDLVLVAPATANAIARLAGGIADDALTATCLATTAPLVIAPAMESGMWNNPATTDNVARLEARGALFVGPDSGALASGREGAGRLAEPERIVAFVLGRLGIKRDLEGVKFLVTAGPTWEPLDPVRVLTNRSTGAMGIAIAEAAARRGASVKLVLGPTHLEPNSSVQVTRVETAHEMLAEAGVDASSREVFIATAAVSDFRPRDPHQQKLKRSAKDATSLVLEENPDILKSLAPEVRKSGPAAVVVGFAAETQDVERYARAKRERKACDLVIGNEVGKDRGFGAGETQVVAVTGEVAAKRFGPASKRQVANFVLDQVALLREQHLKDE